MKARMLSALLLCLCLAQTASAEFIVPEQTIHGAENPIPLGELVDLWIPKLEKPPEHLASVSYDWRIFDLPSATLKRVRQYDSGVFFGAGIKKKSVLACCAVTYLFVVKADNCITEVVTKTVLLTAEVKIGDGTPPDPDDPDPDDPDDPDDPVDPDPVFPDGKYVLAKTTYNLVLSKVQAGADRKKASEAMATSFNGIRAAIAAGTLSEPADILKKTTEANNSALARVGVHKDKWVGFSSALADYLYDLHSVKRTLRSKDDFSVAWGEIAEGLSAVK